MVDKGMLTTSDNPYNPNTHFDEWYAWDEKNGYHTLSFLARIAKIAPDWPDEEQDLAIDEAIEEILEYNVTGKYVLAFPPKNE